MLQKKDTFTELYYRDRGASIDEKIMEKDAAYLASRLINFVPEVLTTQNPRILDDGCGVGKLLFGLSSRLAQAQLVGLELTTGAIEKAKRYAHAHGRDRIDFVHGNALELPFSGNYFDMVISEQVVEHVIDQDKLISEAYRVLRDGGCLFISTTSCLFPWEFHLNIPFIPWFSKKTAQGIMRILGKYRWAEYYEHVFPISSMRLERLLKRTGFRKVEFRGGLWFRDEFIKNLPQAKVMRLAGKLAPIGRLLNHFRFGQFLLKHFFPYTCFVAWKV